MVLTRFQQQLIEEIQGGLPVTSRPYHDIALKLGIREGDVIQELNILENKGCLSRFGVVVKHHRLGYTANAMVVWDIGDAKVDLIAERFGDLQCVSLCYQRPRRLPLWPYNLFTMIHGKSRSSVMRRLAEIIESHNLHGIPHQVLFSNRCFKQRGAHYMVSK